MKRTLLFFTLLLSFTIVKAQDSNKKIELKKVFGGHMFIQDGKNLNHDEVTAIIKSNTKAYDLMKSAKSNKTWSTILGGVGGGLVGFPIGTAIGGGNAKWELAAVGAGLILVAIPIANGYNKKTRKAVEMYNNEISSSTYQFKPSFELNVKGNGLGITMNF